MRVLEDITQHHLCKLTAGFSAGDPIWLSVSERGSRQCAVSTVIFQTLSKILRILSYRIFSALQSALCGATPLWGSATIPTLYLTPGIRPRAGEGPRRLEVDRLVRSGAIALYYTLVRHSIAKTMS